MTYSDKLKDPRWQKKRLEIFERDEWKCRICEETKKTLHVHHLEYQHGKNPWEYSDELLVTLCASCHENESLCRSEVEEILLQELRLKGFLTNSIDEIANGFHCIKIIKNEYHTASIISFALGDIEVFKMLEKLYFNDLDREINPDKYRGKDNG